MCCVRHFGVFAKAVDAYDVLAVARTQKRNGMEWDIAVSSTLLLIVLFEFVCTAD